jgi:hypothetical protein
MCFTSHSRPIFSFLHVMNSILKYIFYLNYIIFAEYNVKYRMVFLSTMFATQATFHTHCVDTFIVYLLIKFHLTTTNCLLAIAIKPKYDYICDLQTAIVHLTKRYLKNWKILTANAMKAYDLSGGIAPLILNVGTGFRWVVSFTLQQLYPWRKSPK